MTERPQQYGRRIRELGYRLTPQRQLILDILCQLDGHATVNQISERVQDRLPTVNLATVYRTVNFLRDIRLIAASEINGQTVYEIIEDTPHHHLVCRRCGHVEQLADYHLAALCDHLSSEHDFKAEMDHLTIPGLCGHCQTDNNPDRSGD